MRSNRHCAKWTCAVLAGVSALLAWNLVRQIKELPVRKFRANFSTHRAVASRATSRSLSSVAGKPNRASLPPKLSKKTQQVPPALIQSTRNAANSGTLEAVAAAQVPASTQAVATLEPTPTVLQPLGYVEKADGRAEAIVVDGEHVRIVHEGDVFNGKYKVLKVSASAVEVVELSPQRTPEPPTPAEPPQVLELAASKPPAPAPGLPSSRPSRPAMRQRIETSSTTKEPETRAEKPLGYVERADGHVQQVFADGSHVQLVAQGQVPARRALSPATSSVAVAAVASLPQRLRRPAATSEPPQAVVTETNSEQTETKSTADSGIHAANLPQAHAENVGAANSEVTLTSELFPGPAARPNFTVLRSDPPPAGISAEPAALAGETMTPASAPSGTLQQLGYVEKADGQVQAILTDGEGVYLVRTGETFANRFRALDVTPWWVEVVDELASQTNPRAPRGSESFKAGTGNSTPSSDFATPARVNSTRLSRPPIKGHARNAREDPAPLSASAETPRTLGYVEWSHGKTEVIVADANDVYLVQLPRDKAVGENVQVRQRLLPLMTGGNWQFQAAVVIPPDQRGGPGPPHAFQLSRAVSFAMPWAEPNLLPALTCRSLARADTKVEASRICEPAKSGTRLHSHMVTPDN